MNFEAIASSLPQKAVTAIDTVAFPRIASGKVREIFDLGDALLLVATDRLSAFDVILPDGIPGKGIILTQMSLWWFEQTKGMIVNHLLPDQAGEFARRGIRDRDLQLRSMVVRKLKPLTIECVVRGYLAGSGWSSYQKDRTVCGLSLPAGLKQADRLPEAIFTPTTKAPKGQHDEPINDAQGEAAVGAELYRKVKAVSLALYRFGPRPGARGRNDPRRHEVRVRHGRGRVFGPHRRGPDAGLLEVLAAGRIRPGAVAAELRQAVRAGPPAGPQVEPAPAGAEPAAGGHLADAGKVPGGVEEPDRVGPDGLKRAPLDERGRVAAGADQFAAKPVQGRVDGPRLHGAAGPRPAELPRPDPLRSVQGDIDRADRILL